MKRDELVFKETFDDVLRILDADGNQIAVWNNNANVDQPEDLTIYRDIGDLIREVFQAGYALGFKDKTKEN